MSFQKPNVFIVYNNNDDINAILAGIFWLKGFEPFKFTNGQECLKRFREMDGNVDAVVINQEVALDNDLMLIVNIKRINPDTKRIITYSGITFLNGSFFLMAFDFPISAPGINWRGINDETKYSQTFNDYTRVFTV